MTIEHEEAVRLARQYRAWKAFFACCAAACWMLAGMYFATGFSWLGAAYTILGLWPLNNFADAVIRARLEEGK